MAWHIWTDIIQPFDENVGVHESFRSNCCSASSNRTLVHSGEIQSLNWYNEYWRNRKSIDRNTSNNHHMKWRFYTFWTDIFDPVTELTFLVLLFWANTGSYMLKVWLSIIFCSVICFMNSYVNICRPSSVASAPTRLITWEVLVVNNGCWFMNRFNHTLFRYPDDWVGPYNHQYISFPFNKIISWVTGYPWLCIPMTQSTKSDSI